MKKNYILPVLLCLIIVILVTGCSKSIAKVTLGQYLGIEVEVEEIVITDEDVENAVIDAVTAEQENVVIKNRPVRKGDTVNIDYAGKVDGVAFEGGTDTGYDLVIGSGKFIEGFEEQIIGMNIGTVADINITFPDPYYNSLELSGAEAVFTVKINSITGKVVPEKITDDMIKEVSDTYSTLEAFREYVRGELEAEAEYYNTQNKQDAVWNQIVNNCKVEKISKKKMDYYADLFENYYQDYADMFGITLSEFTASFLGMTKKDFDEYKQKYAETQVTYYAIAEAIAKKEGISVSDSEYKTYLNELYLSSDEEKKYGESIKDEMLLMKVIEFVTSEAKITMVKK